MEINGNNPLTGLDPNVQRLEVNPQQNQHSQRANEARSQPDFDRVELSVRGREIQKLDELVRLTPDTRDAKIGQVRRAIEDGTYNVRAEKIAEKIIGGNVLDKIF